MNEILRVDNLCKDNILKDVSFAMKEGEMVAIMGPSGSGKSTLLYNVSGMDTPDGGKVWLGGKEVTGLSEDEKAKKRLTEMGFVFQQMNVLNNLNILDNIILGAAHADSRKASRPEIIKKAKSLMEKFHIEDLGERKVTQVSGGQLQRACICRSMMMNPKVLFADEPTGALNRGSSQEVIDAFLQINQANTSILMVTHDSKVASKCERILYIIDGEIVGELSLGKFEKAQEGEREVKTINWLTSMGW